MKILEALEILEQNIAETIQDLKEENEVDNIEKFETALQQVEKLDMILQQDTELLAKLNNKITK